MRILSLILFVTFTCLCFGEQQKPVTKEERVEIEAIIKKETKEKILTMRRASADTVEVTTGVVTPGRLEGGGQTFTLKRTKKGWEIQKRGLWIS